LEAIFPKLRRYENSRAGHVQPLSDALEELGAKRILDRTWALRYNSLSCEMLLDHLSYRIDVKDRVLVFKVSDWAACNALTRLNAI